MALALRLPCLRIPHARALGVPAASSAQSFLQPARCVADADTWRALDARIMGAKWIRRATRPRCKPGDVTREAPCARSAVTATIARRTAPTVSCAYSRTRRGSVTKGIALIDTYMAETAIMGLNRGCTAAAGLIAAR